MHVKSMEATDVPTLRSPQAPIFLSSLQCSVVTTVATTAVLPSAAAAVERTLSCAQCAQCTLSAQYTVHSAQCTVYSALCTVYSAQCAFHSAQCARSGQLSLGQVIDCLPCACGPNTKYRIFRQLQICPPASRGEKRFPKCQASTQKCCIFTPLCQSSQEKVFSRDISVQTLG